MSSCSGNCSSCGSTSCGDRKQESLLAELNPKASVKKVIAVVSGKGGVKEQEKLIRRLERDIEKQEQKIAQLDVAIEAAAADYQELTRLLGEKEAEEMMLMELMEQWEQAQI